MSRPETHDRSMHPPNATVITAIYYKLDELL